MRTAVGICLVILGLCAAYTFLSADVWDTEIGQGDVRVVHGANCGKGAGGCFYIQLFAPGKISSIEFQCVGKNDACAHIHACPDAERCGPHEHEFEISGSSAMFWAWADVANPAVRYKFKIRYQYP